MYVSLPLHGPQTLSSIKSSFCSSSACNAVTGPQLELGHCLEPWTGVPRPQNTPCKSLDSNYWNSSDPRLTLTCKLSKSKQSIAQHIIVSTAATAEGHSPTHCTGNNLGFPYNSKRFPWRRRGADHGSAIAYREGTLFLRPLGSGPIIQVQRAGHAGRPAI